MWRLVLVVLMWSGVALADGVTVSALPPATAKAILRDLDGYLDRATEVIAGFGQDGRLRPDGIALMFASERARARALAMLPLLAADLDGDGAVSAAEAAQVAGIASAPERGRLERALQRAETDGRPGLSPAELAAFGRAVADAAVPAGDLARVQALLQFDADGDGAVTRDEVKAGLEALARQVATAKAPQSAANGA